MILGQEIQWPQGSSSYVVIATANVTSCLGNPEKKSIACINFCGLKDIERIVSW